MPIYEYACRHCGHAFEQLMRSYRDAPPQCPDCGRGDAHKQFSAFAPGRASDPAAQACGQCTANPSCPMAGQGCGAGSCS